jgi:hypothetical protein
MNPRATQYQGPDADDRAIRAFRNLPYDQQFARIQNVIRNKKWPLLRKFILRTNCVQDGLLSVLPLGFSLGLNVKRVWEEKRGFMLTRFQGLSDQQKAERISEAELMRNHGFLAALILKTDCVLDGFINNFPKLLVRSQKRAFLIWEKQRVVAVRRFDNSTNCERFELLNRIVSLEQWRALSDLVSLGRIGLLGFPGEMPEAITAERNCYRQWESDVAQSVTEFGNLPPNQKASRLTESLIFQQTRFIRELLRASMDGFGRLLERVPSAILLDADVDEKWMRLQLGEMLKSLDPEVAGIHLLQRLRSEPLDGSVARLRTVNNPAMFAAWREGWMAFLRSRSVAFDRIPAALANDPEVVLGAWREGLGKYDPVDVLGVDDNRTRRVFDRFGRRVKSFGEDSQENETVADTGGQELRTKNSEPRTQNPEPNALKVLEIGVHLGTLDLEWREGGVADRLETREAWAWAWRRWLLLSPGEFSEQPPLQLRNIPQVLEVWAMRAISNVNSEYSLDEHEMPFPTFQNVTLLNGGLLDCWAHAWSQFARRSGKTYAINVVPRELRSHHLIEVLCIQGLVRLSKDIADCLAHVDEAQRKLGRSSLLKELKRTPIPFVLIPEALRDDPEVRSAWIRGWRDFVEKNRLALPSDRIPSLALDDASVLRAWERTWLNAVNNEFIPWHCLPERLREDPDVRLQLIEKWLSRAIERSWISSPISENVEEREALFFRWTKAWYLLPQKRKFSAPDSETPTIPEMSQENWVQFLSNHPVDALNEIPQDWRDSEAVREAWRKGWVRALKQNAVHPDKIPKALLSNSWESVFEAFRAGWVREVRFEPLSLWELPAILREDSAVVDALVEGWTSRISEFSEQELWALPPRAWLNPRTVNPSTESAASEATDSGSAPHEETEISSAPWLRAALPPLWGKADIEIKKCLTETFAKLHPHCQAGMKQEFCRRFDLTEVVS